MKLIDLDPHWLVTESGRLGMGVMFECPHCREDRLGVWFANPLDNGSPAAPEHRPLPRWQRSGDTFETLTLSPSINAESHGHWHGFITNGSIITV